MKESRIAIRYAKALFELALEQSAQEQVYNDMQTVISVCHNNKDFRHLLASPVIKSDKKQSILKAIFTNNLGKLSMAYLNIIAAKRREAYLEPIAVQYIKFYKDYLGVMPAILTTAEKADAATLSKVAGLVKGFSGKEVELTEEIKSEIIGGFVLKFGQYQYDESIRKKIMLLKREFNINIYEKGY